MPIRNFLFLVNFSFVLLHTAFAQSNELSRITSAFAKRTGFSGSVIVADKGSVVYEGSFGFASIPAKIPCATTTSYRIASITKTFTATLILQLVEEGKIDLNKTISVYLPGYTGPARDSVTIHQLLTYSSGIQNQDQQSEAMYAMQYTTDSIIKKYCSGPLVTRPGTQMNYKNAEYILLGKIIESVTGDTYEHVLDNRIIKPLRMTRSGYLHNRDIIPGLAFTYLTDSTRRLYNDDPYWIENFYSSGAMYASAKDLLLFDQALFTNRLLSRKMTDLMITSYPALWGVAYSFWVTEQIYNGKKYRVMDRRGSISGANAAWYHIIDNNKTIIVLSNSNAGDVVELRELLAKQFIK